MNGAQKLKDILAKNLSFYIDSRGTNQTEVAQRLGIPEMTMSNWMKAKTYPRMDKVQLLADYFNIQRSDLTEEKPSNLIQFAPATVRVPVLGSISCGDPILAEENIKEYRNESPDLLPSGDIFYLKANGDSMEPAIPNGSLVLIRHQEEVENGEVAAVMLNNNEEATLKRVRIQGNNIILYPDNSNYNPIFVDEDHPAKIIGKAISVKYNL